MQGQHHGVTDRCATPQCSVQVANIVCLLTNTSRIVLKTLTQLFIYTTSCETLYPGSSTQCTAPGEQTAVAQIAAFYILMEKILLNLIAFVMVPLYGRCMNTVGSKLPAMVTIFGNMIGTLCYIAASSGLTGSPLNVILIGSTIRGLSGKSGVTVTSLQSYVVEVKKQTSSSDGLGSFLASTLWGFAIGLVLTGLLMMFISYPILFVSLMVLMAICVMCILFGILDITAHSEEEHRRSGIMAPFLLMFKKRAGI